MLCTLILIVTCFHFVFTYNAEINEAGYWKQSLLNIIVSSYRAMKLLDIADKVNYCITIDQIKDTIESKIILENKKIEDENSSLGLLPALQKNCDIRRKQHEIVCNELQKQSYNLEVVYRQIKTDLKIFFNFVCMNKKTYESHYQHVMHMKNGVDEFFMQWSSIVQLYYDELKVNGLIKSSFSTDYFGSELIANYGLFEKMLDTYKRFNNQEAALFIKKLFIYRAALLPKESNKNNILNNINLFLKTQFCKNESYEFCYRIPVDMVLKKSLLTEVCSQNKIQIDYVVDDQYLKIAFVSSEAITKYIL